MDRPTSKAPASKRKRTVIPAVMVQVWPPLLVIAIGMAVGVGGVYAGWFMPIPGNPWFWGFVLVLLLFCFWWLNARRTMRASRIFDLGALLISLFFGIVVAQQQQEQRAMQPKLPPLVHIRGVLGLVVSDTITKASGITMTLRLLAVEQADPAHNPHWQHLDTAVFVQATVQRPKLRDNIGFGYGDTVLIRAPIRKVTTGMLPNISIGGFDYGKYLQVQGVYYQTKVEDGQYQVLVGDPVWYQIRAHLLRARAWLQKGILTQLPAGNARGLVLGLALGLRQGIDKAAADDFSVTGTAHVLSVSGMHTMVFFNVLSGIALLIGGSNKRHRGFWVWGCIVVLWLYVVISGLSPAAVRAVAMTTVMLVGQSISRQTNMLNSLGLAVWVMLMTDPSLITQPSFQLSVAGCVGLATLGQTWSAYWRPDHLLLRLAWETGAITLAATILTLPISIYHFGQVPLLFLPANILVGGLSSVLTVLSIALSVMGQLPVLGWVLAQVSIVIASVILWLVDTLASVPIASLKVRVGDMTLTAILGLGVFVLFQWWWHRQRWAGYVLLTLPLLWLVYALVGHYRPSQQGLWVWSQKGEVHVVSSLGDTVYWLGSAPDEQMTKTWQLAFPQSALRVVPAVGWASGWWFDSKSFLLVTDKPPRPPLPKVNISAVGATTPGSKPSILKPQFDVVIGQTARMFGALGHVQSSVWICKYPKSYLDTANRVRPYYLSQQGAFEVRP